MNLEPLIAVFEDGPQERPRLIVENYLIPNWPYWHEWITQDNDGALTLFVYQHTGEGHYRISHRRILEVAE